MESHNLLFRLLQSKSNDKIFQKLSKILFFAHFGPVLATSGKAQIFQKIDYFNIEPCGSLTSCKTSRSTNDSVPKKYGYKQADG